jgi:pimeloyl-ACP methyl ester carboxylesterase
MLTVDVPTLVLWAMDDPALLPGLLDGLPDWVHAAAAAPIEHASHWVVHEHPERVAQELGQRFLLLK